MFCGRATGSGVFSFGPPQPKHFRENTGFFTKPATGEKNLFLFEGVKMVQYIHIFVFFWGGGGQNDAIYTLLEFNFFRKTEKQNTILS